MATLNDLFHYWGTDLTPGPTGDLQTVGGTVRGQQRILRRLLTNPATDTTPGDYIFEDTYGGGLPSFIGQTFDKQKITARINGQMLLEDAVAPIPPPVIDVAPIGTDNTAFSVSITYQDAATNTQVTLSFNVGA
jgi:hypothetical protein